MKKILKSFFAIVTCFIFVDNINAIEHLVSTDEELKEAFATVATGDIIKLGEDIVHVGSDRLVIDNQVEATLDLNGHNLSTEDDTSQTILVNGGKLTITGTGTISIPETASKRNVLNVWGSETDVEEFSTLIVGENVTLKGSNGIAIFEDITKGYGIYVDFAGKIEASMLGISPCGTIKNEDKAPVIIIRDGAEIHSKLTAIYAAGAANWTIGNAKITGLGTAIGIKSGTITINGGTFTSENDYSNPEIATGDIKENGSTILIEGNNNYVGNINLIINGGTFISKKGYVIEEYRTEGIDKFDEIKINGGSFIAEAKEEVFSFSDEFKAEQTKFITKGFFSSDVSDYVIDNLIPLQKEDGIISMEYEILEGSNQKIEKKDEKLSVRINADITLFQRGGKVYVDGEEVDSSNYTVASGSTIITLNKNFLDTLSNGNHVLTAEFNNGAIASTTFTIAAPATINPQTFDGGVISYIALLIISAIGIIQCVLNVKKRKSN